MPRPRPHLYLPLARLRGRRVVVFAIAFWTLLLVGLTKVGLLAFLEHRVVRVLEFRTREMLGHSPELDPHLKAYALDDSTAALLGGTRLDPADWVRMLRGLEARKPRSIMIDGMFGATQNVTPEQAAEVRRVGEQPAPIVVGALLTPKQIDYRASLPTSVFQRAWDRHELSDRIYSIPGAWAYGPAPMFQAAFRYIGHIMQLSPVRFAPAVRIGDGTVVPHLALFAAHSRSFEQGRLIADGITVPLDQDGLTPIDVLPPEHTLNKIRSLRTLILKARVGEPLDGVNEDDAVLLISNYSTGNTDIHDSPFGPLPGGYVILSIMNSVLSGKWLQTAGREEVYILGAALLGALVGAEASSLVFWLILGAGSLLYLTAALATFVYAGVLVPWLFPLVSLLGAGLTTYSAQRYAESIRRLHLEHEVATASALQKTFFPAADFEHAKFSVAAHYAPAEAVGGDWYSYGVHANKWLHIHLGDVTGHGASAALLASFAKGATDMLLDQQQGQPLAEIPLTALHNSLNQLLGRNPATPSLMTLVSLAIDLETGECHSLNSGHPGVLALRPPPKASAFVTERRSTILGFRPLPANLRVTRQRLVGDETLVIVSDGVFEATSHLDRPLTERRLQKLVADSATLPVAEIRERITRALYPAQRPTRVLTDDVTFLVVKLRLAA